MASFADRDSFTSFLVGITFLSFSSLTATVRTSQTMLSNSGESGHPCVTLIFFIWDFLICRTGSMLLCGVFSRCTERGPLSSCRARVSWCGDLCCCRARAPERVQWLWCVGLVALWLMGIFWTRDRTHVSYMTTDSLPVGHQGGPLPVLKKMLSGFHR